jgi:hypothetical protein
MAFDRPSEALYGFPNRGRTIIGKAKALSLLFNRGPTRVRRWAWLLARFCICLLLAGELHAQKELDPAELAEVKELVLLRRVRGESMDELAALEKHPDRAFATREMRRLRAEKEGRVRDQIQTGSGLKPYLFAMLDEAYRLRPNDGDLRQVLEAIAMRDDLKPEDVAIVRSEVAKIFANPTLDFEHMERRGMEWQYLTSAMAVLARDLTPESEALLMQGLAWPERANVNVAAAKELANAGVARALPVMQATVDRLTASGHLYAEYVLEDLQKLKGKVGQKPLPPAPAEASAPAPSVSSAQSAPPVASVVTESESRSAHWWKGIVGLVLILAAVGVGIWSFTRTHASDG